MEVEMNDSSLCLGGKYSCTIRNETPAALQNLFFHLYENAFQPESYYHRLHQAKGRKVKFGDNERNKLGTICNNVKINGKSAKTFLDNTILKVVLPAPLMPGDSLIFEADFETYFDNKGSMRRRNKFYEAWGYKHFNGVHFYPVLCRYDEKGWHTDQNLDKEFYANFGDWDVKLTFPDDYILDATGILQNEATVLPDTLREKIELKNFAAKPFNEKPSLISPRTGKKTWHFKAENVHNFAFTAAPTYRRKTFRSGKIEVVVLVKEPNASKWQQTPDLIGFLLQWYSLKFGKYPYPKLLVVDAAEGFECGMTALVGGQYPYHVPLIAHELAHQWYQGAVGNNERRYPFMDEGFAEFMTIKALAQLTGGDEQARSHKNAFIKRFLRPYSHSFGRIYYPYLQFFWNGFDKPLKTFASDYHAGIGHEGGYGLAYQKGTLMLLQLEMMLGEQRFWDMMRSYFEKFCFKNPYPEDFWKHVSEHTPNDWTWFFEQWFESEKYLDYSIKKFRRDKNALTPFSYQIELERRGTGQSAFFLQATGVSGKKYTYFVPNSYEGFGAKVEHLPVWYGFGEKLNKTYSVRLSFPEKIMQTELDPDGVLPDVRRDNNLWRKRFLPEYRLYRPHANPPAHKRSEHLFYPDFWFNRMDGIQAGVHLRGNYLEDVWQYRTSIWVNTRFLAAENLAALPFWLPFSFKFSASGKASSDLPRLHYYFENQLNANIYDQRAGVSYKFARYNLSQANYAVLSLGHKLLSSPVKNAYALQPALWSGKRHSVLEIVLQNFFGRGVVKSVWKNELRTPFLASETQYSFWQSDWKTRIGGKKIQWSFRMAGRVGFGEQVPESGIYLYGDNPEGMATSRLTRARITMNEGEFRFADRLLPYHQGGGLNVRGFTGYSFWREEGIFWGQSGAAFNSELDFADLVKLKPKFFKKHLHTDVYAFFDAAKIFAGNRKQFAANAGFGIAFHLKTNENDQSPFIFRIDAPFWLSDPYPDGQNFRFRYVFGVGRAF
jgi:aminopeptidase N